MLLSKEFAKKIYENGGDVYVSKEIKSSIFNDKMEHQEISGESPNGALFNLAKEMFEIIHIRINEKDSSCCSMDDLNELFEKLNLELVKIEENENFIHFKVFQNPAIMKYDPVFQRAINDEIDMTVDECKVIAKYEVKRIDEKEILNCLRDKILSLEVIVSKIREKISIPMDNVCLDVTNDELVLVFDFLKHQLFISVFVAPVGDRGYLVYEVDVLSN